jgi:hypothetical protein
MKSMMEPDDILARIGDAVALDYAGDRDAAHSRLATLWHEIHPDGEALHRCMLAHYMADMQADPRQELVWDLRALEAAGSLNGSTARDYHPSLHLNLAEDYRKLGDWSAAREHLAQARESAAALPANGYGKMIDRGIEHMASLPEFAGERETISEPRRNNP